MTFEQIVKSASERQLEEQNKGPRLKETSEPNKQKNNVNTKGALID